MKQTNKRQESKGKTNIIYIRTTKEKGFWKQVKNSQKNICDHCHQMLWISPGKQIYCNEWENDHDIK